MVKILGMRHGQKDKDKLTPEGAKQVFAAGEQFIAKGFRFDRIIHSGANRTKQSAHIIIAALKLFDIEIEENQGFIYSIGKQFHTKKTFPEEMAEIQEAGGTLAIALHKTEYAKYLREYIREALLALSKDMNRNNQNLALVIAHSPSIITPSPDPTNTPYGISECDGILYTIENGKIADFKIIKAPIKGSTMY